jgi:hypothetical protein
LLVLPSPDEKNGSVSEILGVLPQPVNVLVINEILEAGIVIELSWPLRSKGAQHPIADTFSEDCIPLGFAGEFPVIVLVIWSFYSLSKEFLTSLAKCENITRLLLSVIISEEEY